MDKKIQPPLYEGGWHHVQHSPPDARKLITHAEKNTQAWIDSSLCLSGSVESLNDSETGSFIVNLGSDDEVSDDDSADEDVDFDYTLEGESESHQPAEDSKEDELSVDDESEESKELFFWVQCDNKTCRKWRMLDEPWLKKRFVCRLFTGYACTVACDGCELCPCMCQCEQCHQLLRAEEPCRC